jgi:V/A-type H+-transporting ATPase subunit B
VTEVKLTKNELCSQQTRLGQLVSDKVTREDHGDVANAMIRLYAESKKARERQIMGFKITRRDEKLLRFSELFEGRMMNLEVDYPLEEALDLGWQTLAECFDSNEVGIKDSVIQKYWKEPASVGG